MDSLITAAARALATGDPLGALNRVALRDDAPALALRGIAMAQLGDLARASTQRPFRPHGGPLTNWSLLGSRCGAFGRRKPALRSFWPSAWHATPASPESWRSSKARPAS